MAKTKIQLEELPRLSPNDPALVALNKIAEALDPYDRLEQFKILASVCAQLGMADYAITFMQAYKRESE